MPHVAAGGPAGALAPAGGALAPTPLTTSHVTAESGAACVAAAAAAFAVACAAAFISPASLPFSATRSLVPTRSFFFTPPTQQTSELVKKTPGPVARRQRRVSYGGDGGWGFWPNSLAT